MSILKFIKRVCVQPAVYWTPGTSDGYGGKIYTAPKEILCRWEDKQRLFKSSNGVEFATRSEILVQEELAMQGWLYLGTLASLSAYMDSEGVCNPQDIEGAYEIVASDKTPLFRSSTQFVYTVFLGFKNLNN